MFGLSTLGVLHTAISLAALVFAGVALLRHRRLSPHDRWGFAYGIATLLAALTSLFLFSRGGFGPAHVLAVLTLVALAVGSAAAFSDAFGRASRYVHSAAWSATLLFHAVPGVTETLTRLPPGAPLLQPEAPQFKAIYGVLLGLFVIAVVAQWIRIWAETAEPHAAPSRL